VTATAIFECKQSRADFMRDSRSRTALLARLATLDARKLRHEATLRPFYLTLHHGDALFRSWTGATSSAREMNVICGWWRRSSG